MAIKFCECLSYSMEVKHPRFSFSQAAGRYQLQGQRSCSAINCLLLVPTAAETYYFQHQITKLKKKKEWLVRWPFWAKVYALILVEISGSFLLYHKQHTWGQVGAAESRLKLLEFLCHLLGASSFDIAAHMGSRASPPCLATDIFDKELVLLLLPASDVKY